jgi:hypothetical protein
VLISATWQYQRNHQAQLSAGRVNAANQIELPHQFRRIAVRWEQRHDIRDRPGARPIHWGRLINWATYRSCRKLKLH